MQAYKKLHPRQQEDIRNRFDRIPTENRAIMRQHWLQMTAEERIAERRKFSNCLLRTGTNTTAKSSTMSGKINIETLAARGIE